MANESTDVVILQLKIDEGTGKKMPDAKKEVEALIGSISGLTQANKKLREERNKLDTQTAEGARRIQEINKLIDENNELIKQNSSNLEKQRMNVGNYKRGVTDALKEVRIGGINVGDVVDKLSKANEDLFQGMIQGYKNSGIQAKLFGNTARTALTLTGIGALVAGLATIITYWDDITDSIGITSNAHTKFYEQAQKEIDAYNEKADYQKRVLQAIGASHKLILTNDLFNARQELYKQVDILTKREEDLAKAQASGWITSLLKSDDAKKAYEDQKAVVENLRKEIELMNLELDNTASGTTDTAGKTKASKGKQNTKEQSALAEYEAFLQAQHDLYLTDKARREEVEQQKFDITKRFNDRIIKETKARADQEVKIERSKDNVLISAKLGVVNQIAGIIGQLAGKNKALGIASVVIEKAAAIAQIISNTAIANAKAIAVSPITGGQPWVAINTASGIASGIATAAQAGKSIQEISSAKFALGGEFRPRKYATGGLIVGGRSHSQGGTTYTGEDGNRFEVERGEGIYVLKKTAQEDINFLSSINQSRGGRSFSQKSWYAAMGGQIETRDAASASLNRASLQKAITQTFQHIDFYVRIDDINNAQDTGASIKLKGRAI